MSQEIISLLTKLVSFNSIFPNEKNISDFLFNYLNELGFKVEKNYVSDNRYNILAEKGEGHISYLLYAHTDTVPIYGNWLDDPFKLRVSNNIAIGLGAADMKGGIVAILKAIEDFEPKNYKLKVAFGVDEENYSLGAFEIVKTGWLADVRGILVPESSIPASKSDNAGSMITLGRKGRAVYTIKIYGKSAHGVEPKKGINAIEQAANLVINLNDFEKTSNKDMGSNSYFVRRIEAKTLSLSIPDYAELEIDCHLVYPDNSFLLMSKLESFIKNLYDQNILKTGDRDFEIIFSPRPTPFLEPFIYSRQEPFIKIATKAVTDIYQTHEYNYGQCVADENVFGSIGIPTLTIGPVADNHHSSEEWVEIDSLVNLKNIYRKILEEIDNTTHEFN